MIKEIQLDFDGNIFQATSLDELRYFNLKMVNSVTITETLTKEEALKRFNPTDSDEEELKALRAAINRRRVKRSQGL